jgi:Ca2+-binding RTX toxin-like protein
MRLFSLLALTGLLLTVATVAIAAPPGAVNQRGDGWPPTTGMVLLNQFDDDNRPLDGRPGRDPFGGTDPAYRCDDEHRNGMLCHHRFERCESGMCVKPGRVHNKLLGGHGDDTIFAGPGGDVLWGDYKPGGGPRQTDRLTGGRGRDFIYGSKGHNIIRAGAGNDFVKARYGWGRVNCGPGRDVYYTSGRNKRGKRYKVRGCERITIGASPGQGGTPIN